MSEPTSTEPEICNFCEAPLRWVRSTAGRPMPLNRRPDPDRGNVFVGKDANGRPTGSVMAKPRATAARDYGVELYLHHAATCPFATSWNKPGQRR